TGVDLEAKRRIVRGHRTVSLVNLSDLIAGAGDRPFAQPELLHLSASGFRQLLADHDSLGPILFGGLRRPHVLRQGIGVEGASRLEDDERAGALAESLVRITHDRYLSNGRV